MNSHTNRKTLPVTPRHTQHCGLERVVRASNSRNYGSAVRIRRLELSRTSPIFLHTRKTQIMHLCRIPYSALSIVSISEGPRISRDVQ